MISSSSSNMSRSCFSSDPRDKIYALLGLLRPHSGLDITPNYNESAERLYMEVAKQIIQTTNHLDILSEVGKEVKWWVEYFEHLEQKCDRDKELLELARSEATKANLIRHRAIESMLIPYNPHVPGYVLPHEHVILSPDMDFHSFLNRNEIPTTGYLLDNFGDDIHGLFQCLGFNPKHLQGLNIGMPSDMVDVFRLADVKELMIALRALHIKGKLALAGIQEGEIYSIPQSTDVEMGLYLEHAQILKKAVGKLTELAYEARNVAKEREKTVQKWKEKELMEYLTDGFLLWPDWLTGEPNKSDAHITAASLCLPSWVPDLSRPVRLRSLDLWRQKQSIEGVSVAETVSRNLSSESTALKVKALRLEKFCTSEAEPARPNNLHDLPRNISAGIRAQSISVFLEDFTQSFEATRHGATIESILEFSHGRKLGITEKFFFFFCPLGTRSGDLIYLIYGSCVPFVLRSTQSTDGHGFELIGECYLHGLKGPKSVGDDCNYLDLLGAFAVFFEARSTEGLPWQTIYLE